MNDWIHEHTTWKTFYHTCGAITAFFDDFHEAGIDILNPVQISAKGMDPEFLKTNYGDKFVFWGGAVDPQGTLPFALRNKCVRKSLGTSRFLNRVAALCSPMSITFSLESRSKTSWPCLTPSKKIGRTHHKVKNGSAVLRGGFLPPYIL